MSAAEAPSGEAPQRFSSSPLDALPDDELERLNQLLPWAAFVLDGRNRELGRPYSETKRNVAQTLNDKKIVELDARFPLRDRTVLELGCFEGIHTIALARKAKRVLATDGRIENVVKTLTRCAMFGYFPTVFHWNLENPPPDFIDLSCDVLHHVGVLYHLGDPVHHFLSLAKSVREAILLDTHIAAPGKDVATYEAHGREWAFQPYREGTRDQPFAGLVPSARWLTEESLIALLETAGFGVIDIVRKREERNGHRITIYCHR